MKIWFAVISFLMLVACGRNPGLHLDADAPPFEMLSSYGIFKGELAGLHPDKQLIPYDLSTPLFSDYAEKQRLFWIPPGKKIEYRDSGAFSFPVGSFVIKTFYFPFDMQSPLKGRDIIETRILVHRKTGWEGLPYIWNAAQTDAKLEITGGKKHVAWTDEFENPHETDYLIPDKNQCKACHDQAGKMQLLGPKALLLNYDLFYKTGKQNQLKHWAALNLFDHFPGTDSLKPSPFWNNFYSADLNTRARVYLDINCAHCHNPNGTAASSGLNLAFAEKNPTATGRCKMPVAAGHGSGNLLYNILPGKPDSSIMIYRMNSNEAEVMMPELGRTVVHREGVTLIREWIAGMVGKCE